MHGKASNLSEKWSFFLERRFKTRVLSAGMQRKTSAWSDSHMSQRCEELERALKAAALHVASLEGDAMAAASHISILQAQKAALAAK